MKYIFCIAGAWLCLCACCFGQEDSAVQKYSLHELFEKLQRPGQPTTTIIINEPTMQVTVSRLPNSVSLLDVPDVYDAVYYVTEGNGKLQMGNELTVVGPGSIVYVKSGTAHRFLDCSDHFTMISIASKANTGAGDSSHSVYNLDEIGAYRSLSGNVWIPFLKRTTMIFGLYMLPQKTGGDSTLVHRFDEVNIITKGSGKFSVDKNTMDVEVGDIVYVRRGRGHYFHALNSDLDILILFEKGK